MPSYMQPKEDALQQDIDKVRAQVPNGKDDGAWQKLLASYGLNEADLKEHLRTEFQTMNFIEVRLRPTVHVQDEDVEAYYRNQLIPDLEKTGGTVVALPDVAPAHPRTAHAAAHGRDAGCVATQSAAAG